MTSGAGSARVTSIAPAPEPPAWSAYSCLRLAVLPAKERQCSKGSMRVNLGPRGISCTVHAPASTPRRAPTSRHPMYKVGMNSPRVAPRRAATGLSAGGGTNLTGPSLLTPGRPGIQLSGGGKEENGGSLGGEANFIASGNGGCPSDGLPYTGDCCVY